MRGTVSRPAPLYELAPKSVPVTGLPRFRPVLVPRNLLGSDAGGVTGVGLGPLHVVVAAGHDALGEQAAARLEVGHEVPAAIGVGGEVADGVEELDAVLGAGLRPGAHVLLDVGARVGVL